MEMKAAMTDPDFRPTAKKSDLLVTDMESGEVFDRKTNKAHCLNPAAAVIWKASDGRRTVEDLAIVLAEANGGEADQSLIWMSLKELRSRGLMGELPLGSLSTAGLTRRQALARFGSGAAAAAALVPVVATVLAPKPAAAVSCLQRGQACSIGSQCCSGSCVGLVCG